MDRRFCNSLTLATLILIATSIPVFAQNEPQGGPPGPGFEVPGFPEAPGGPFGGPEGMNFPPMFQMPQMPEMAKKMSGIMILRALHEMRFTAKDISSALPSLKSMRDAEKTLESKSNQILDEEKKALLASDPDSSPPPDSGQKMGQAMEAHRQQTERAWDTLSGAIGRDKANGLRGLLGQGGPFPGGGFGGGGFGSPGLAPNGGARGLGGGQGLGRRGGGLGGGTGSGVGRGIRSGGQGVGPGPGNGPGTGIPGGGAGGPQGQFPGVPGAPQVPGQPGFQPGQNQPFGGPGPGGGFPGQPGQNFGGPGRGPGQGQPGQPGFPPRPGFGQGGGPGNFGPGMPGMGFGGFGGPRTSLAELIELMEQKLGAMKK